MVVTDKAAILAYGQQRKKSSMSKRHRSGESRAQCHNLKTPIQDVSAGMKSSWKSSPGLCYSLFLKLRFGGCSESHEKIPSFFHYLNACFHFFPSISGSGCPSFRSVPLNLDKILGSFDLIGNGYAFFFFVVVFTYPLCWE